jgi:glycosyltransferase involved in cell wall biosynthesis
MDILILNWKDIKNPDVGGAEIILYELAKRLVKDGHRVTWFSRKFPGSLPEDTMDGISVVRRGNRFTVYWEAYRYYQSLSVKPDKVLDCINTICWQTPLYVPHEKRIAYVNQLAKEVFFYELPPFISHIAYLLEPIEYRTYKKTHFVCYSDSVRDDLTTFGISKENIDIFPIGIDHKRYTPGKKSQDPLFIFVARLASMKRPDMCVQAMQIVVKHYPKAKLAIVGYGPMERKLKKMIHDSNLENNVYLVHKDALFFDSNSKDQKVKLMQQAWALLLPSVKEGWGMVVTESGACGTPSIGSDVTGLKNSIVNNKTGILLSKNPNREEISKVIISLISHKSVREMLSKKAQTYAQLYTWERSVEVFKKIMSL